LYSLGGAIFIFVDGRFFWFRAYEVVCFGVLSSVVCVPLVSTRCGF
jgi:hypothetical protein